MSETKNGLPQQPESTQDNDTTKRMPMCPILSQAEHQCVPCMGYCAWYVYDPVDGAEGCALAAIAEVLSLAHHYGLGGGKS